MNFEDTFKYWLENALQKGVPGSVKAFSFNLFEYPETNEVKFGVELVGTETFDESDSDWACDEIWEPEQRTLAIPISYSGKSWEDCFGRIKELVTALLNCGAVAVLKSRSGVGVGFVDGDIEIVWP